VTSGASGAQAQSLFQSLFGGLSSPTLTHAPQTRGIPASRLGQPSALRALTMPEDGERAPSGKSSSKGHGGGYRTVCVRTCDGYYWPISANVSRSKFYRDADICRSSCGTEAKLYYQSADAGDAKSLIDLQGRPYTRTQTAFMHRKLRMEGCACKPDPWSQAELDRHYQYAVAAGVGSPGGRPMASASAEVVAGGQPSYRSSMPSREAPAEGAAAETSPAEADSSGSAPTLSTAEIETPAEPATRQPKPQRTAVLEPSHLNSARPDVNRKPSGTAARRSAHNEARMFPGPASRAQQKLNTKPATSQSASLLGGGAAKYTWPGDPPTRYR
jgi:hypothetical protein